MSKSTLATLFTNSQTKKKVNETHSFMRRTYAGLTLEECLVVGYSWKRDKIEHLKQNGDLKKLVDFFSVWEYQSDKNLNEFELYNMIDITAYARWRAEYVQRVKSMGYTLTRDYSIEELETLSLYAGDYASVTLAIKCYLLGNFKTLDVKTYKGVQPLTKPVQEATEQLFGRSEGAYRHSLFCNSLSSEVGMSSTFINTAFYHFGY